MTQPSIATISTSTSTTIATTTAIATTRPFHGTGHQMVTLAAFQAVADDDDDDWGLGVVAVPRTSPRKRSCQCNAPEHIHIRCVSDSLIDAFTFSIPSTNRLIHSFTFSISYNNNYTLLLRIIEKISNN